MRQKLLLITVSIGIIFLMSGCQNAFSKFYTPYSTKKLEPTDKVYYLTFANQSEVEAQLARGYYVVGYSSFSDTKAPSKDQAISHAKSIGADAVMLSWKFQNTESQAVPIMNYTPGTTSTTYANANAYGSNGSSAYGYGTSTTYTQGTYSTSYAQRTTHRYSYIAYYLKQLKKEDLFLGTSYGYKNTELSKKIGTNSYCPLEIIYLDSPAYKKDIMKGDIVLKINGNKVSSCKSFYQTLKDYKKKMVSLEIWRDGKIKNIDNIELINK